MDGEVRVTNEVTGGQKGQKDIRYDLIPVQSLKAVAKVYGYGCKVYSANNWRRGYDWSLSQAALLRHYFAFADGEMNDPESGLPHLAHAAFHIFALLEYSQTHPELDDRWLEEGSP